ncbi:MAG: YlbF family regulator [Phycisphaeraceae bacterium]
MTSTQEIVDAARKVGELIAEHDAAKKMEDVLKRLEDDRDAQRILTDYNRQVQEVAQKEMQGQPVEVEDKRKLEDLQKKVVTSPVLRDLQMAQMDYVDLMRKVDEAIGGQTPTPAGGPAINPEAG